jgi:DNA-binding CsgD family transcriptional regulator
MSFPEVVMGRPPEVFVRPVTMTEGRRLQRIGRTAKDPVKLRRAIVVLMSAQGQAVPDIAQLLDCSPEYVRGVIHRVQRVRVRGAGPKMERGQAQDDQ